MTAAAIDAPRTFFGQPRALAYLAFTEAWERFSYYGMSSLMALYMSQALFLPGHVEHIAGFAGFRSVIQSVFGPMTTLALASQTRGLYTAFVYLTPVLGGWIADRFIGRRAAVTVGAVMMSAGHIAMAFDASFLLALLLLIVGTGLLKGNISTQVGELYPEGDAEGRTRGFAIFSMAINVGAVAGPLACAFLAQIYGWHAGFALAGVLMIFGLLTYLAGYRALGDDRPRAQGAKPAQKLGRHEWAIVAALAVAASLTIFPFIAYLQNGNMGVVWIDKNVDLNLFGFHIPAPWFTSLDALTSIVAVPFLFALWRWQAARGKEPDDIGKIATGCFITALANVVLFAACLAGPRSSLLAPVVYSILIGIAFLYYWPVLLALVSRAAPTGLKSTLIGTAFVALFISNFLIGWVGGFYERMTPAAFWGLHAVIATVGGALALLLAAPLRRVLKNS